MITYDASKFIPESELQMLVEQNKHIYTDYFDDNYSKSLDRNIFQFIDQLYFRCEYHGFETLPKRNNPPVPLIFVGNHSGMTFPWDGIIFMAGYFRKTGYVLRDSLRAIIAPQLAKMRIMNAFLVPKLWLRAGGIPASTLNFETMMQYEKTNLFVYPEGVPGIGKGFNNKYKIQRFAISFIRMSVKYKTDIFPIACVNGEYINPYSYSFDFINRFTDKYLKFPFLPISWMLLLLPIFPWLFYFAFPAKLIYVKGKTIKPYEFTNKKFEDITIEEFQQIRDTVQHEMQQQLNEAVSKYEKGSPFKLFEYLKNIVKHPRKLMFTFAPAWPLLFDEHERQYNNAPDKANFKMEFTYFSLLLALIKNPKAWAFFIPIFGWIFIIYRGYFSKKARI